jgi:flagellin-like hook-associated protein FlgL
MNRIATFAQNNLLLYHTMNTVTRVQDLQVQLATDKKAQSYAGIEQDAQRLVSLENRRIQVDRFLDNISVGTQRIDLMDLGVASIEDMTRDFRSMLTTAVNGPDAFDGDLAKFAADMRLLVGELLNSRDGDRYLFGGGRVDRPPVDLSPPGFTDVSLIESDGVTVDSTFYEAYYTQVQGNTLPFAAGSFYEQIFFDKNGVAPAGPLPADPDNPTLGEFVAEDPDLWQYYVDRLNSAQMLANPKTDYYQGDGLENVVRADDDLEVTYDLRADLPTFQQLLTALDAVANLPNADTSDPFERAVVLKAMEMLDEVLDPLAGGAAATLDQLRMELARARDNLTVAQERHEGFFAYAEGVIHDLENIDRNEVIVKLQSQQQVLEASYASLAQVQSLTLLDFL